MKHNGHFTFSVFDSWGKCSDEKNKSGTTISFDVVCAGSSVIVMVSNLDSLVSLVLMIPNRT